MSRIEQGRVIYFDIFRGVGIVLMILLHIGVIRRLDHLVHAFHMPMFFFVAGYFYSGTRTIFGKFIWSKIRVTLIPYFAFGILLYGIWTFESREWNIEPLKDMIWENTDTIEMMGPLWFLTAFFVAQVLFWMLSRICLCNVRYAVTIIIALFGCLATHVLPIRLPWAMDAGMVGVGLMFAGYWCKLHNQTFSKIMAVDIVKCIIIAACTIVLIFVNGSINMRMGNYACVPLFWLNAMLSIFIGLRISYWVEKNIPDKLWNWIIYIGRNSIVYLCLNRFVVLEIRKYITDGSLPFHVDVLVVLLMSLLILHIFTEIITRTKLRILIGKA